MTTESKVNGVWNGILSSYFKYPYYIIAPEYWVPALDNVSGKGRTDLSVISVAKGRTVLHLEGKRDDQNGAVEQLTKYLAAHDAKDKTMYGLAVSGNTVAFYRGAGTDYYPLGHDALGVGIASSVQWYDLTKEDQLAPLHAILRGMVSG